VTHARTVSPRQSPGQTFPVPARFLQRPQLLTRFFSAPVDGTLATAPVTAPLVRLEHRHRAEEGRETQGTASSVRRQARGVGLYPSPNTHPISRAQKRLLVQRGCDSPS
jgi:hypothetical protein